MRGAQARLRSARLWWTRVVLWETHRRSRSEQVDAVTITCPHCLNTLQAWREGVMKAVVARHHLTTGGLRPGDAGVGCGWVRGSWGCAGSPGTLRG